MLDDVFSNLEETSPIDILNALLDQGNIETKSELNLAVIKSFLWTKWIALMHNKEDIRPPIQQFEEDIKPLYLKLCVSRNRESRKEIVDALKHMPQQIQEEPQSLLKT